MRTNIEIDDEVMREAQHLLGASTKRETVDMALRELVARHRRLGVLDLAYGPALHCFMPTRISIDLPLALR